MDHWVHQYGPELDERVRRHVKPTNGSWRVHLNLQDRSLFRRQRRRLKNTQKKFELQHVKLMRQAVPEYTSDSAMLYEVNPVIDSVRRTALFMHSSSFCKRRQQVLATPYLFSFRLQKPVAEAEFIHKLLFGRYHYSQVSRLNRFYFLIK
jgi:hypothetical protein